MIIFVMYITILQMQTTEQYTSIETIYDYYNKHLFDGKLSGCMLSFTRRKNTAGYFSPNSWTKRSSKTNVHEIAINPETTDLKDHEFHQTLVHEMVHQWQEEFGTPSRKCYHNKEWAAKMVEVGLMPYNVNEPDKMTGQSVSDRLMEGEKLFYLIQQLEKDNFFVPLEPKRYTYRPILPVADGVGENETEEQQEDTSKNGKKFKFTCSCKTNLWGKYDLDVTCNSCNTVFLRQE